MAAISPVRPGTAAKPCSGPTSAISRPSSSRTGRRCRLGRLSTFRDIYFERDLREGTLTESAGTGNHRRPRHQVGASSVSCVRRSTTSCSRATRHGSPRRWQHGRRWPLAGDEDRASGCCRRSTTSDPRLSPTSRFSRTATAGHLQPLRHEGGDRHQLHSVRERRDHAPHLGRRRRRRLLRVADAAWASRCPNAAQQQPLVAFFFRQLRLAISSAKSTSKDSHWASAHPRRPGHGLVCAKDRRRQRCSETSAGALPLHGRDPIRQAVLKWIDWPLG